MTVDAIKGTYANFRLVKSRGICVIEVEVPVEASKHALDILGGMPVFGQDTWVAIARLREPVQPDPAHKAIEAPEKVKQPLRASAMAGIMCADPVYWKFLFETRHLIVKDKDSAAAVMREWFGISTRSYLDIDTEAAEKFHDLRNEFIAWRFVG